MADPEIPHSSRRRVARTERHRRLRRIAGSVSAGTVVVAAIVVALVLANVVRIPGSDSAHITVAAPAHQSPTGPARAHRAIVHRALTPDHPLRLWIAGDSLAGSIGPSLGELTANTGVVQPQYDSRVSSGLLNPNFFNWPKEAAMQLALVDPEVVVFVIGTNDANVWSANRADDYRLRTEAMMRELVGTKHRQVYWIGAPVMRTKSLEAGVLNVNLIARATAATIPRVTYVDAHALFDDDQGHYQQSFVDDQGHRQVMRADDGVHFSVAGADYIGRAIFALLDPEWRVTAQSVPSAPKRVLETKGSTQVPGTHKDVGTQVSNPPTSTTRPVSSGSSTTSTSSSSSTTSSSSTPTTPTTATSLPLSGT